MKRGKNVFPEIVSFGEIVCYYYGETVSEDFTCPEHRPEVTA